MNIIKKHSSLRLIISVLIAGLLFSGVFSSAVVNADSKNVDATLGTNLPQSDVIMYDSNKNLTEEEISQRFHQINSSYDMYEPFSEEDAEFVVNYANAVADSYVDDDISDEQVGGLAKGVYLYKGTSTTSFSKTKTAQGVSVKFSGTVKSHINSIVPGDQWYSGNTTAKITSGSSKVKSIKTTIEHVGYGLIGNSGTYVGLVHSSKLTSTSGLKAKVNYLDKKKKYTALLMVYNRTEAFVTINTTTGSYNLYGV